MKTFLENLEMLSLAAGTSGDEAAIKKLIYDEVIGYPDCVAKTDNAGNLIVPIVTYVLGEEWVIYSSAFLIVQLVFLWTHGVRLFSDDKLSIKKIILNVNMIAVL